MKRLLALSIFLILLTACGGGGDGGDGSNVELGSVEGTVTDLSTGYPIEGVTVKVGAKTATSGLDGVYAINDVEVGTRTVTASCSDYQSYSSTCSIIKGVFVVHDIQMSQQEFGGNDFEEPTVPSNMSSGVVLADSISLNWSASADNVGVEGYNVYRDGEKIATVVNASYNDESLQPDTEYCYSVSAYDAAGNQSDLSLSLCRTTLQAVDEIAPSVPNSLDAVVDSTSQISLTWEAAIDDSGFVGYDIYRNGIKIATSNHTAYVDNGLAGAMNYCYFIKAYDGAGNQSGASEEVCEYIANSTLPFEEDFEDGSLSEYVALGYSGAGWDLSTSAYEGSYALEGQTSDSSSGAQAVYVNTDFALPDGQPVKIEAYVKNTSHSSWNRPNTIIFGASESESTGYAPQIEHNQYLSLVKLQGDGAAGVVGRTPGISVSNGTWYRWVVYYDPTASYTKFEVYDLGGALLGSIESDQTPVLGNRIGFRLWRGDGAFDDLTVQEWGGI